MKQKILLYLKEQEGFVSGQDISNSLGVSRTAIWKYINALREEGYVIESLTRKGYRLVYSPDVLSKEEILKYMPSQLIQGQLEVFQTIDSTNEEAKRAYGKGASDGSLFVSDQQTSGKGRRGRSWISPKGQDIFFSFLLRPQSLPPECASMVTLIAALAGVKTVESHTDVPCQIKWPNDIVMNGKKVCGILTEMSADMDSIHYLIPGIGFNLNRTQFDESIGATASSVSLESGHEVNRARFVADFTTEFNKLYEIFLREQNLSSLMDDYNNHLINVNRQVKIIRKEGEMIRTALGINEWGELLVRDDQGEIEKIFSGEVSVRGLYGYV